MTSPAGLFDGYRILAPPFDPDGGRRLGRELFGVDGDSTELGSHQDRNFKIVTADGRAVVLKVANPHFGRPSLEMQNAAMEYLAGAGLPFATPRPVPSLDGRLIVPVERDGLEYDVRMVGYLPGEPLTACGYVSPSVRVAYGRMAGRIALALAPFDHPAAERVLQWDLKHARAVVDELVRYVSDPERLALVERAMRAHDAAMERLPPQLRVQVIHGDVTDYNVLGERDPAGRLQPTALIDFGDMTRSYLAGEAAVAAAAIAGRDPETALQAIADVIRGFHEELPLTDPELAAVFPLVLGRAASGAVSTEQQAGLEPDNRYANDLIDIDWGNLAAVAGIDPALAEAAIRAACGIDPHPGTARVHAFLAGRRFTPPVDPAGRRLALADLGVGSDRYAFGDWEMPEGVARAAGSAPGELSIGRYGEPRLHRSTTGGVTEPRTVHLGADVFAPEGEPVRAPFGGTVISVEGDRLTMLLEPDGVPPVRLIIEGITASAEPGPLAEGDRLGEVGPAEGRALPHLHLQLALLGVDPVPGWAPPSLRDAWLAICPDPSPLLGIDATAHEERAPDLLVQRRDVVAGAQRTYFEHPPEMVRGWRHRLYDADGREYIDMVNNVAVLGHSHPAVAGAAVRQLRLLNTNSRFLMRSITRFAERLAELVPDPLGAVFLVNSGSEANELALRIARTVTGRTDVLAVEGAYHGWTGVTFGVSTSPADDPDAPPSWLRVVPQPNPYRGTLGAEAGPYADAVRDLAAGAAALISEAVLGNAGGVLPPAGYVEQAYAHVRAAGGLCIADEVQVGYGRLGHWFWAFEGQGVVPDIVTVAKATGNGHPVGAVITTREIAESFGDRHSFFSSVGGSPVSCEVGIAVLDAIRDEHLQENACDIGARLRTGLDELAERHPLIGAVHGTGLYLGVELVRDHETLEPATDEAYAICERLRELGVIDQPTGDFENVLKVKPPLCISAADADAFVARLDRVLTEGW
jgi:4-aminobutyrate aminotransferase-like enzyme/Ser/Thr protein kinase RdoA (MazF antagonist)